MNLQKMTKKQLEAHGRTIGIELDRRKSKKDMISELNKVSKKSKVTKKKSTAKKKTVSKKPNVKKQPIKKPPMVAPKVTFWGKVKKFLNL